VAPTPDLVTFKLATFTLALLRICNTSEITPDDDDDV
jgi:hypothetical protein